MAKIKQENLIDEKNIDLETVVNNCVYSTTEQKIGKWIDNKDLYRKTYVVTLPSTNNRVDVNLNSLNYEHIHISGESFLINEAGSSKPLVMYESNDYNIRCEISISKKLLMIFYTNNQYYRGTAYLVLEYTKNS